LTKRFGQQTLYSLS